MEYWSSFVGYFVGYAEYVWREVTHPHWGNYLYWMLGLSLVFWGVELVLPWRERQAAFRQDFFLDLFYLAFNFVLFSLIGYHAISMVLVDFIDAKLAGVGMENAIAPVVRAWPLWIQIISLFLLKDLISYLTHRMLHRVPWLWRFHQVHHSVEEMGFAAHMRYHWMENIVYAMAQYIPFAFIGVGISEYMFVHLINIGVGHFNHANTRINIGPLGYIFNNPRMHIWHHAKKIPSKHGVNFGITLSIWDYLFGTAFIPKDGKDEKLGFPGDEHYPKGFWNQSWHAFRKKL